MDHLTYNYFDTMENLRNTLKLLVVRDPWERLLSAYRDKLEAGNTDDQQAFQMARTWWPSTGVRGCSGLGRSSMRITWVLR